MADFTLKDWALLSLARNHRLYPFPEQITHLLPEPRNIPHVFQPFEGSTTYDRALLPVYPDNMSYSNWLLQYVADFIQSTETSTDAVIDWEHHFNTSLSSASYQYFHYQTGRELYVDLIDSPYISSIWISEQVPVPLGHPQQNQIFIAHLWGDNEDQRIKLRSPNPFPLPNNLLSVPHAQTYSKLEWMRRASFLRGWLVPDEDQERRLRYVVKFDPNDIPNWFIQGT